MNIPYSKHNNQITDKEIQHIKSIITNITTDTNPNIKSEAYNKFEQISTLIKQKNEVFQNKDVSSINTASKTATTSTNTSNTNPNNSQSIITQTRDEQNLFKISKKKLKQFSTLNTYQDDILNQSKLLEWAGITFTKLEWYKIKVIMNKLLNEKISYLKFWGKIFGKNSDYYIIQGKLKEEKDPKFIKKYSSNFEPRNLEGLNNYVFWVSNNILDEWVELPDITPSQLGRSRLFKYICTGSLNAKVKSFVPFDGNESHFLKCQIIRIMHASYIVPDGYLEVKTYEDSQATYGVDLTDKVAIIKEGFEFPTSNEELLTLEKWVHEYAYVFDSGKVIETNAEITGFPRMAPIAGDKRK